MIKEIQGLRRFTDCSMPSNENERIHKAETAAYNQAINDVIELVKNCSIPNVSGRSEQLKCYHYDHEWKSDGQGGNLKYCNDCKCYV